MEQHNSHHQRQDYTQHNSAFFKDSRSSSAGRFVIKKTEAVVAATLLVTDTMSSTHPLTDSMRHAAIRLMKVVHEEERSDGVWFAHLWTTAAGHLQSLLEVARLSGLMSSMNCVLLKGELNSLRDFLEARIVAGAEPSLEHLFTELIAPALTTTNPTQPAASYEQKGHTKDGVATEYQDIERNRGQATIQTSVPQRTDGRARYQEQVQSVQKDRRATILGLLQKKDRINIKDVSNVIKDCSEKTLQRELLALVAQGVLKKEGERRWSTYALS